METIHELKKEIEEIKEELTLTQKELKEAKLWREAPNRKCLTSEEVGAFLGVCTKTVQRYERQGLLIALYPQAKRRFDYQDVVRFMEGYAPTRQARARLKKNDKNKI